MKTTVKFGIIAIATLLRRMRNQSVLARAELTLRD